jgi:hypothetical protein
MIGRVPFPDYRSSVIGLAIAGNPENDGQLSLPREAVGHQIIPDAQEERRRERLPRDFDGPARAVRYATAIANQLVEPRGLTVCSDVHTGEIELVPGDIAGIAVHSATPVAARSPGQQMMVWKTPALCATVRPKYRRCCYEPARCRRQQGRGPT